MRNDHAKSFGQILSAMVISTAGFASFAENPVEYFVATNGVDTAGGGTTEAAAFRTIQYAVDTAQSGDIVTLLPGDHIEGLTENTDGRSRVYINNKALTLRSKRGEDGKYQRDVTRIVGVWDEDVDETTPVGMGDGAVRCVVVSTTKTTGTRFEGITFYRGSTCYNDNNNANKACGGGLYSPGTAAVALDVVDCAFVDCQATRGGGFYSGQSATLEDNPTRVVRCLFRNCRASNFGDAQRGGCAYYCVYDGNGRSVLKDGTKKTKSSAGAIDYACQIVNCTFVCNDDNVIGNGKEICDGVWNCLFVYNAGNAMLSNSKSDKPGYCVYEGGINGSTDHNVEANVALNPEVASTATGDYRLVPNALSLTTANVDKRDLIPEAYRLTDYLGNDLSAGTVYCGAVQSVTDGSGVSLSAGDSVVWTVDGTSRTVNGSLFVPVQSGRPICVKCTPVDGKALVRYSHDGKVLWPKMDDSAWLYPKGDGLSCVGAIVTENVLWIDPNYTGTFKGTEAQPYKDLKSVFNVTRTGDNPTNYVFYAKPGDYNSSGNGGPSSGYSRFYVANKYSGNLRVKSVDGAATTFITGEPATETTSAFRCAYVGAGSGSAPGCVALQGFTLRQGRTSMTNEASSVPSQGGALVNAANDKKTAWLVDCEIEDCSARRGLATCGGTVERCVVRDCENSAAGNDYALFYGSDVRSSLVTGCGAMTHASTPLFYNADVANVTVYGNAMYVAPNGQTLPIVNSVLAERLKGQDTIRFTNTGMTYSLYDTLRSEGGADLGEGCRQENPVRFTSVKAGDYRLRWSSLGVGLGRGSLLESAMDLNGEPYLVDAQGFCMAGCYASSAPRKGLAIVFR